MTITHKFRSVGWVATVAAAALACYLISYRVAAERDALESVERDIAHAREDILALNTEFATRSRMSQLEVWNSRAFVLSAPEPEQVLEGEVELASLFDRNAPAAPGRPALVSVSHELPAAADRRSAEPVAPEPDGAPRLHQATYIVPADIELRARIERVALLDEKLRGEIAERAALEQRRGDVAN